jgi:hypothetical protein
MAAAAIFANKHWSRWVSLLVDQFKTGQDMNWMKHTTLKCEASWQDPKVSMKDSLERKEGRSNGGIDNIHHLANSILRKIAVEDSTYLILDSVVETFTNDICFWFVVLGTGLIPLCKLEWIGKKEL